MTCVDSYIVNIVLGIKNIFRNEFLHENLFSEGKVSGTNL